MKIIFCFTLAALLCLSPGAACRAGGGDRFIAIAYHDVVQTRAELASDAVTIDHLISQFEWLLANHYHPISIDDLLAARAGKKNLPSRAVLLCWDDGYASFYTLVFPLLKAYNFPAVLALEGSWIEPDLSATVRYGVNPVPRTRFLTWPQLRELAASPLIEIASHSYDLHHGVLADRFGDTLPAVTAHQFDPGQQRYESDQELFARIYEDLEKNSRFIQTRLGVRPRVMVWPFGRYNQVALAAAEKAGMDITLTLNPVPGNINNLKEIGRLYPTLNPDLVDFRGYLNMDITPPVRHFFKVESGLLLDSSPDSEEHFSLFLDRLKRIRPAMVSFSPVVEKSDGLRALFPNRFLPMLQDRLIRFTWHTSHRGGAGVFLWLPSILFRSDPLAGDRGVKFFEQMGKFAFCEGLLVDSPALVSALFRKAPALGTVGRPERFWDPARRKIARNQLRKMAFESEADDTLARLAAFQKWQPFLEVGLVLPFARLQELTPQRAGLLLGYFDFLLFDGRAEASGSIYKTLHRKLAPLQRAGLLAKISFLFSRDDRSEELFDLFTALPRYNIINWGYEYDDFLNRRPPVETVRPFISHASDPFEPERP